MQVKCPNCRFKFEVESVEGPAMCVCPRCSNQFAINALDQSAPEQTVQQSSAPVYQQPQPGPVAQMGSPVQQPEPPVVYVERQPEKNNTLLYTLLGVVSALLIVCGFLLFNRNSNDKQAAEQTIEVTTPVQESSASQPVETPRSAPAASSSLNGHYTLTGQLANRPIEMSIRVDGNDVYGSYVYVGLSQVDIDLYGSVYGNRMELHETNEYGEHSGDFIGTFDGSSFDGTFHRYRNGRNDKNFDFYLH